MSNYNFGGSMPGGSSWSNNASNASNGNHGSTDNGDNASGGYPQQSSQGPPGPAQGNNPQGNHHGLPQGQQPLPNSPYARGPMYGSTNNMFNPRTAAADVLQPHSPFDQTQQHYASHDAHAMASTASHHSAIMATSQPSMQPSLGAHSDAYTHVAHSRPNSNPGYYASSGPSQFASYPPAQHSPTQASPSIPSPGARGMGSLPSNMHSYRHPYQSYGQPMNMSGPVMSNMHQPGGQMSIVPGMNHHHQGYGSQMMYNGHHSAPAPQSERPFKCDQCIQSFSRNHDLKRHKRIHLAVKPFPCNFCSKSFSRKDALKVRTTPFHNQRRPALTHFPQRHRLVKGCENKNGEQDERKRD